MRDTWRRAYRVSDGCISIPDAKFAPWHKRRMLAILGRATVIVARDERNPHYIYGYGVFERIGPRFVAHWVYVREQEKRQGIGRLLLAAALAKCGDGATELVATHRTYIDEKAGELGFVHAKLTDLEPYADVDREDERTARGGRRACG